MSDQKIYYKDWPKDVPKTISIPDKTLVDFLEESVKNYPNNAITNFMGFQLSYTQLQDIVYRTATKLHDLGLKKGETVALQFTNNPAYISYYYGVLKAGGVVTNISPLFKSLEVKRQLNDSDTKIYIGWEGFNGIVEPIIQDTNVQHKFYSNLGPYLTPDPMAPPEYQMGGEPTIEDVLREINPDPPQVKMHPEDIAMLQYTGGTTGFPKGAMLTHKNIVANVYQIKTWLTGIREGEENFLAVLPFYHIYMCFVMNAVVHMGNTLTCVFNPRETHEVIEAIESTKVTIFPGIAPLFNNINNFEGIEKHDLSSIKYCFSGAAPLPDDVRKRFEELSGAKVREVYGLTEMSPAVTANTFGDNFKSGTAGMPLPNTDVKIVGEDGKVLGLNNVGELWVRGPQMMKGYYKRPKETADTIIDGWLRTGDMALMDDDGRIVIKERLKDMIKYKGHSVYPTEVEDLLFYNEAIEDCAVVGIIDENGDENIKAFIVLKEKFKGKINEQDIVDWSKKNMGFEKYPRYVEFIEEIPKTIVGKILHRELREKKSE
ncbi:MAG: long-chain fatty acid--CoA ligase [Promethearchaeota archaeon]|nr:MAG: long-chain fatty acid--CoA ligase [Candidatus Lokiarchaeota archaeon]